MRVRTYKSLLTLSYQQCRGVSQRSPGDYCLDLVRNYDHENYFSTLLLPSNVRTSAIAIRAFNIEIANVHDIVSDIRIGQMRMKFWEETLEKLYKDDVAKHPVASLLHCAVKRHKLSKRYLKRLISSRTDFLVSKNFQNVTEMENYAEHSVSSIYYLILQSAGIESVHADHVASHLGKAQGIANLIRSTVHNAKLKMITVPQDVLLEHKVSHEQIFRFQSSEGLKEATFSVAKLAKYHLDKARSLAKDIPKHASVVFLPAVTVESYLERLQDTNFDIFDGPLQHRNALLPLVMYWRKMRSKY